MSYSPYQPASAINQPEGFGVLPPQDETPPQLKIVGIILIVMAVIGLLFGGFITVGNIYNVVSGALPPPPPDMQGGERAGFFIGLYGSMIAFALSPLLQPLVIWGGINMVRGRGLRMAYVGAIIATIPVFSACCIIGMPFGIWALVVLSQPQVRAVFTRNGG